MKAFSLLLCVIILLSSCAPTHQVGATKHAAKSKRFASERVGSQFSGVQ